MRKLQPQKEDPFREKINDLLFRSPGQTKEGVFRSRIYEEIQAHSKILQHSEYSSDLFFRLCELVVDCQSFGVPDDSFRILLAHLLYESSGSKSPSDEGLRAVLGMEAERFERAKEKLNSRECISLLLDRKKPGRKGGRITSWRGTRSVDPVEVDI